LQLGYLHDTGGSAATLLAFGRGLGLLHSPAFHSGAGRGHGVVAGRCFPDEPQIRQFPKSWFFYVNVTGKIRLLSDPEKYIGFFL
jgi:hypothetical protein